MNADKDPTTYTAAFVHLITGRSDQRAEFIQHVDVMVRDTDPDSEALWALQPTGSFNERPVVWLCPHHEEEDNHRVGITALVDGVGYNLSHIEIWMQPDGKRTWLLPNPIGGVGGFYFDDDYSLKRLNPAPMMHLEMFMPEIIKTRKRLSELAKLYSD